ncbi:MAG: LPPG--FO 2-phospho-L-lactate transferase [Alphaproteobacteria bacterium]|nr:MAG: LPPG--FO 2-phospho-L-lactate transferase [Alphaproteobacteria bacterium]
MILVLAGGVGGAKLASGLAAALAPGELVIAVNTGDDFEHLGLHISPDLDTIMYTLAGIANPDTGWGQADETWNFMASLGKLGGETWFNLGDRDLATSVLRSHLLSRQSLSTVTAEFCRRLGIVHPIVPMSDQPVRTIVDSDEGELNFQDYFVRRRCRPKVRGLRFEGAEAARPSPGLEAALAAPDLAAIVICPSNPLLSVAPMLALPGMREAIGAADVPVVAVSPIIAGQAVKGPAAKLMGELRMPVSCVGVAEWYGDLLTGFVIDASDAALAGEMDAKVLVTPILMRCDADRLRLACEVVDFAALLGRNG